MEISFTTFLLSISSTALLHLNECSEKKESSPGVDLLLARQNIDLLEMIEEKTRGNLSEEEEQLLKQVLFEIRMRFVEAQKGLQKK